MNTKYGFTTSFLLFSLALVGITAQAGQLGYVVTEGPDPVIMEISDTGLLSNASNIVYQTMTHFGFVCLVRTSNDYYYGLTRDFNGTFYPDHLFSISPTNGGSSPFGFGTGEYTADGDCAIDPTTGVIWAVKSTGYTYTLDFPQSSAGTHQFTIPGTGSGIEAIAFNGAGQPFVLDLSTKSIYRINKSTGSIDQTIPISAPVAQNLAAGRAAMSFDPNPANANKLLVLAPYFNSSSIQPRLFRIDSITGNAVSLGQVSGGPTNAIAGFTPIPYSAPTAEVPIPLWAVGTMSIGLALIGARYRRNNML